MGILGFLLGATVSVAVVGGTYWFFWRAFTTHDYTHSGKLTQNAPTPEWVATVHTAVTLTLGWGMLVGIVLLVVGLVR